MSATIVVAHWCTHVDCVAVPAVAPSTSAPTPGANTATTSRSQQMACSRHVSTHALDGSGSASHLQQHVHTQSHVWAVTRLAMRYPGSGIPAPATHSDNSRHGWQSLREYVEAGATDRHAEPGGADLAVGVPQQQRTCHL